MATSTVDHEQSAMLGRGGPVTAEHSSAKAAKCETQNKTVINDARLRIFPGSHELDRAFQTPPRRAIPVLRRVNHPSQIPLRQEVKARALPEESHASSHVEEKWTAIKNEAEEKWTEIKIEAEAEASNAEDSEWQIV
ncbi:hypothetical protein MMC29_003223 [Sticta canariensis]|nr:hypothetical protein [Sticta canariensis]